MDLTNKSFEDILTLLVESGSFGAIVAALIIGLLVGHMCTKIYYTKFENVKLNNELAAAKSAQEKATTECEQIKDKYQQLLRMESSVRDNMYAHLATQKDERDPAISNFIK